MAGRGIEEQEQPLRGFVRLNAPDRAADLVRRRLATGDAEAFVPPALVEQRGKHRTERRQLVEEADAADADRTIAEAGKAAHDVGRVEHECLVAGCLASGEARGEE